MRLNRLHQNLLESLFRSLPVLVEFRQEEGDSFLKDMCQVVSLQ